LSILIVSPHLDDETLGAGGTLLRYAAQGESLYWINVTNSKEEYGYNSECVSDRVQQLKRVQAAYGIKKMWDLSLKPASLDTMGASDLIQPLAPIVLEVKPHTIILPYEFDIHSDHGVVFRAMLPFTKPFRYPFVKKVLAMEILSETEFAMPDKKFAPNYFVDITDFIEQKMEIMRIYRDELGEHPFPRSVDNIKALAHFRGAIAGVKYAEAFLLLKCIESDSSVNME
jgi:LmbE family N-acetylglucosaminyl deacetylase